MKRFICILAERLYHKTEPIMQERVRAFSFTSKEELGEKLTRIYGNTWKESIWDVDDKGNIIKASGTGELEFDNGFDLAYDFYTIDEAPNNDDSCFISIVSNNYAAGGKFVIDTKDTAYDITELINNVKFRKKDIKWKN